MSLKTILKGFSKLALSQAGIIKKNPSASKRWNTCVDCEDPGMDRFNKCNSCGCFIPAKILVDEESCPEKKW